MKEKRASKKLNITILLLVALFTVALSIVGMSAKYKRTVMISDQNVTFSAELVGTLTLTESAAIVGVDGVYTLDTSAAPVTTNTYKVLPGVDIPKDPKITITDKTDVDAYLYVELKDNGSDSTISYSMSSDWMDLDIAGRTVYVYTKDGTNAKVIDAKTFTGGDAAIYLLKDNKVVVSDTYAGATFDLTFNAYMVQTIDGKTAKQVFETVVP